MLQFHRYRQIFGVRSFRLFWLGFTASALGDAATRVALTWYVLQRTNSPEALGVLAFTYTAPVIVSGLFVGTLLDRFDRRRIMMADNFFRGCIMLLVPILHTLGLLELWHVYGVSLVYGSLVMISLAGSPALVPDLVPEDQIPTANALETLSYTLSAVVAPLLAGILIPLVGAPNVVLLDALSYFLFGFLLLRIQSRSRRADHEAAGQGSYRMSDGARLLLGNRILLSTTLMFMAANLGFGALFVWLPILTTDVLRGDSSLYGILLGALAIGELASSLIAGIVTLPVSLGRLIGGAQALAGCAVLLLLTRFSTPVALISLFLLGFFTAPLTIWAQTLRMRIIPAPLRGRTFALLRMLMQSTNPAGGMVSGFLLPLVGLAQLVAVSGLLIGVPGVLGLSVRTLRDTPSVAEEIDGNRTVPNADI